MTKLLPVLDDMIPHKHGFFTRIGGQSSGVYASSNCGLGSQDQREDVIANRHLVAQNFDLPLDALKTVYQIHSADAVLATSETKGDDKADALVSDDPSIAIGILTADCAPILFSDPKAHVVAAAHSGWKGAIGDIADATLSKMEELGAKREEIIAIVGPCISQENYEIGAEFYETFMEKDPDYRAFFKAGATEKHHFDLPRFCLSRLAHAGVTNARWTGQCTYAQSEQFFSYRRSCHKNEPDYGRQISVIQAVQR